MAAQQNDHSLIHSSFFLAFSDCFYFPCEFKISHQVLRHQKKEHADHTPFLFYLSNQLFAYFQAQIRYVRLALPAWKGSAYQTEPDKKDLREDSRNRFTTGGSLASLETEPGKTENVPVTGPSAMERKGKQRIPPNDREEVFLFYFILWNGFERGTMESDLGLVR